MITCDQVHQALVDSIELRWKPLKDGKQYECVPSCQLCLLPARGCDWCPLSLTGNKCSAKCSPWNIWCTDSSPKNTQRMIDALQLCLDTYFKEWGND